MTVSDLWYSKKQEDWKSALERYWKGGFIRLENIVLEEKMDRLSSRDIQAMDVRAFYDWLFYKYFQYKFTVPIFLAGARRWLRRYLTENNLNEVGKIKEKLFSLDDLNDEQTALLCAKEIHGLGVPGASGLLALLFPKNFGTVDQFVVRALLEIPDLPERNLLLEMKPKNLSIKNGVTLIKIMKEKANELNRLFHSDYWTPRKIDMILWTYGRNTK